MVVTDSSGRIDSDGQYRISHEGNEYVFAYREGVLGETVEFKHLANGMTLPPENFPPSLIRTLKSYGYRVVLC